MTTLGRIVAVLGVVLMVAAVALLFKNVIAINLLYAVASSLRVPNTGNPVNSVLLTVGLSLLGGVLAGVGGALAFRR